MAYNGHSMFQSNGGPRTPYAMRGWRRWSDEQLTELVWQINSDDYPEYEGFDRKELATRVYRELDERSQS